MFPHHMDECQLNRTIFEDQNIEKHLLRQMIFDLRDQDQRRIDRLNGSRYSLRREQNLWDERPSLIFSETVPPSKYTRIQSIHHLKAHK